MPLAVLSIALENVDRAAAGGVTPDAVVRFAPESERLALATFGGWLRIVSVPGGSVLHERRIAEGVVKTLAWSPDGRWLYAGEQSPDALLLAIDTRSGDFATRRLARCADWVETSQAAADDRYGLYTLPAVHDLEVADDGRLFAAATHSWVVEGTLRNRSALACFAADGELAWWFPPGEAAPLMLTHIAIDRAGTRLAVVPSQSQVAEEPLPLRTDALALLDGRTGVRVAEAPIAPLVPHSTRVESWDSVAVTDDATRVAVGLVDGRGLLYTTTGETLELISELRLGTPIVVGGIPLAAPCSYTRIFGDRAFFQTQDTHIPLASPLSAQQAPTVHRGANRITVVDADGRIAWRYAATMSLGGFAADRSSSGARWLAVPCRPAPNVVDAQHGLLLFDLAAGGGGGERLVWFYPTAGPLSYAIDVSPDGRWIALVETPAPQPDTPDLYGSHRLHLVH
jgi:hypothetical protein